MFIRRFLSAAAGAFLFAVSHAQGLTSPANPSPAAVKAGIYAVEPIHTRIVFAVSHMGFTTWYGDFTGASGSLVLDPKQLAATRLEVRVPIASVTTTNTKLDGELKGTNWFDAAHFPVARFVSRKVTPTGPNRADVVGDLTLHGVTHPLTLHAVFNGAGVNPLDNAYTVGFDARGVISRSAFGVARYVPLVGDHVELILSAAFERKPN
ncbi:MAG: YceI family protein [Xanthobacteraceae bacterium]